MCCYVNKDVPSTHLSQTAGTLTIVRMLASRQRAKTTLSLFLLWLLIRVGQRPGLILDIFSVVQLQLILIHIEDESHQTQLKSI